MVARGSASVIRTTLPKGESTSPIYKTNPFWRQRFPDKLFRRPVPKTLPDNLYRQVAQQPSTETTNAVDGTTNADAGVGIGL